jgi:hypothetical protein
MSDAGRWTTTNLAALCAIDSAMGTADLALQLAATEADDDDRAGEAVELTRALERATGQAQRDAVVLERVLGRTWAQAGEALGVARQAAQKRFGPAEERFRLAVALPQGARQHVEGAPPALLSPDATRARIHSTMHADAAGEELQRMARLDVDDETFVREETANTQYLAGLLAGKALPAGVDELLARVGLQDRRIALYKTAATLDEDPGAALDALMEAEIVREHLVDELVERRERGEDD